MLQVSCTMISECKWGEITWGWHDQEVAISSFPAIAELQVRFHCWDVLGNWGGRSTQMCRQQRDWPARLLLSLWDNHKVMTVSPVKTNCWDQGARLKLIYTKLECKAWMRPENRNDLSLLQRTADLTFPGRALNPEVRGHTLELWRYRWYWGKHLTQTSGMEQVSSMLLYQAGDRFPSPGF